MATTAAIKQYNDLKDRVGDSVLLFRMGDFYEMFDGDAVICSKVLGILGVNRKGNLNDKSR